MNIRLKEYSSHCYLWQVRYGEIAASINPPSSESLATPSTFGYNYLMQLLPLGIQTFRDIIAGDYCYIDKTEEILTLISTGKYYFLSRPRRFGKSLLVSTLKEIFMGSRELFKNLYIYAKIAWETHPVIHLDFSVLAHDTPENLQNALLRFLENRAEEANIALKTGLPGEQFEELIKKLSVNGKVVILIDEYDKPILENITAAKTAKAMRAVLRSFFSVLKGCDPWLRFVFLTGVTKFNKVSVFSDLNNLLDITLDERFSAMLGITQEELVRYFPEHMKRLSEKTGVDHGPLMEYIKEWYNGYSWDGVIRLYNPTSILSLFTQFRFVNYWFSTATPMFLIDAIKERKVDPADLENRIVNITLSDSYDIGRMDIYNLLFQTGYLTITETKREGIILQYRLGYPNYEVKDSFLQYLLAAFTDQETTLIQPLYRDMLTQLASKDIPGFQKNLVSLFSRIPYTLHIRKESYYHSLCYMILTLMGAKIDLEVPTDKGRVDAVLELGKLSYIIEFKMGKAAEAMRQIKEKRYWEPYLAKGKEINLLGVGGLGEKEIECLLEKV